MKLAAWGLFVAITLLAFPPFHIRPEESGSGTVGNTQPGPVDIPAFALEFWETRLVTPAVSPTDARTLVEALNRDKAAAAARYGRHPGLGGPTFYFLAGVGRVVSVDHSGVWLDVGVASRTRLVMPTGLLFGNALRDATGLLDVGAFSSLEFNELGTELDRLAETRAQPPLRADVRISSTVTFLAAGQTSDVSGEEPVIKLIPIHLTVK